MDNLAPRLRLSGLSKSYGSIKVLSDVGFEVRGGEVLALLGENGAGKSTLVKILAGLVGASSGTIEIDGQVFQGSDSGAAQKAGIAIVTQEFSLVPALTVAENLSLGRINSGVYWSRARLHARARPMLRSVGLDNLDLDARVERLSVAEMQLLEIARVVSQDAKIVIFDEPTATLSDAERDRVANIVRGLAKSGKAIIYVTHRMGEVFDLSDSVQVLRNGVAQPKARTADVGIDDIVQMMLGRTLGDMFPPRRPSAGAQPDFLSARGVSCAGLTEPVSLGSPKGAILGLTGQVASGASDFLEALAGLRPCTGDVELGGSRLDLKDRLRGIRQGVAYCSADRKADGIFAGLNIVTNLSSPWLERITRGPWLLNSGAEKTVAHSIASVFAIDKKRLGSAVGELSGGNQQKVALGKWLGINPRLLLADEPTRGVDVGARAEIYAKLRAMADDGMTIVIASTDTSEILGLCDIIGSFFRGRLTELRPRKDWSEHDLTRAIMHDSARDAAPAKREAVTS